MDTREVFDARWFRTRLDVLDVKDRGGSYPAAVEAGQDLDRLRQHPYAPARSNSYHTAAVTT